MNELEIDRIPACTTNLHLMLARGNCSYFEQPVPYAAFEAGSRDVIRTDHEGYVHPPPGDAIRVGVEWAAIEAASLFTYELARNSGRKAIDGRWMR